MNYYLLSVETSASGKKIKISLALVVVMVIIIATILGIQFASYVNGKNSVSSLVPDTENTPAAQGEVSEETQIAKEVENGQLEIANSPRIPILTEQSIQSFNAIYNSEEKIAYLTFDDGPSTIVTPLILDILKENDVPATFFVLGNRVKLNPSIVKRAYEEGHYIANHGYSHVYSNVYSSKEAVLEEYNSTEVVIRNALEVQEYNSHIFRFPGGSTGTGKYSNVKKEAKQFLAENGIMSVDWNCLTGDSEGKYTKEALLEHLYFTSENKGNVLVVLMHDAGDKILTAETLQEVIDMLRDKGYAFKNFYNVME